MVSYKVKLQHGKITAVEFWEEGLRARFCKIMIEKLSETRYYTTTNWLGRGQGGLNVTKSLAKALAGLPEDFQSKVERAFQMESLTPADIWHIFPGAEVITPIKKVRS